MVTVIFGGVFALVDYPSKKTVLTQNSALAPPVISVKQIADRLLKLSFASADYGSHHPT